MTVMPAHHALHENPRHYSRGHDPNALQERADDQPAKGGGQLHRVGDVGVNPGADEAFGRVEGDRRSAALNAEHLIGGHPDQRCNA